MGKTDFREKYNFVCQMKGTCSFYALWYGLKSNQGRDKLRFLKSYIGNVWRWMRGIIRLGFYECRERKNVRKFVEEKQELKVEDIIKPIAIYLPQFYTFPENDTWWGKGFTEWTNVKKALPLFTGHYEPHIPHPDIGYYDLSDVSVMKKQVNIAKKYGIYGFCFYYYHFANGKRLLEKPINNWLAANNIDFPFCYAWANENWTRAWDGGEKEIIMPQDYNVENMKLMMSSMLQDMKDSRYIKVGENKNTPVLMIYRAEIVPQIKEITTIWRNMAKAEGFDDLFLVSMQNFKAVFPKEMGMDAATEFASLKSKTPPFSFDTRSINDFEYNGKLLNVIKYKNVMRYIQDNQTTEYIRYKCCVPSWDNTPRKGENGWMLIDSSPKLFKEMFSECVRQTLSNKDLLKNGFIFINAWNEWGEGAHLEPDIKNGYANLEAIHDIMSLKIRSLI